MARGVNTNPKRLEQVGYAAQIMVGISAIVGGIMIASTALTIVLVVVGMLVCLPLHKVLPERITRSIAKKNREARRWHAWVMYLGMLVMAVLFLGAAWKHPERWWYLMMGITFAIWLSVPPPWLVSHLSRRAESEGAATK